MSEQKSIMVFVEQNEGKIQDITLELISEAKKLAIPLNAKVTAVALGHKMKDSLKILGHYGCDTVYYVDSEMLAHFTSVPYSKSVTNIIKEKAPYIVLFGATTAGRDIAPRVASKLKCGLTADCTDLQIGDHKTREKEYKNILLQIRPAFGGNIVATIVSPESTPSMATVREGVMKLATPDTARECVVEELKVSILEKDYLTEIIDIIKTEKTIDIKGAKIIVAAGMGASTPLAMAKVKELAKVLGGEVAASRPVVDGGHLVKEHQVGQTGVTVRPNLYIACGISGQIQHRAGMSESKRIIAINIDPDAPIFKIADYGIVGDVTDVVSKMIKAYQGQ